MAEFGKLVREMRERGRVSRRGLAELVGLNAEHLGKIEAGTRRPPRRDKVIAIAQELLRAVSQRQPMTQEQYLKAMGSILGEAGYSPRVLVDLKQAVSSEDTEAAADSPEPPDTQLFMYEVAKTPASGEKPMRRVQELLDQIVEDPTLGPDELAQIDEQAASLISWMADRARKLGRGI